MDSEKLNGICPHQEILQVSENDASLGVVGTCKKLQGRCAYYNNPEEFQKINSQYQNCFIYKNINK
jgi:hypothetical protein